MGVDELGDFGIEGLYPGLVDKPKVGQGVAACVEHVAVAAPRGVGQAQLGAGGEHPLGVLLEVGELRHGRPR